MPVWRAGTYSPLCHCVLPHRVRRNFKRAVLNLQREVTPHKRSGKQDLHYCAETHVLYGIEGAWAMVMVSLLLSCVVWKGAWTAVMVSLLLLTPVGFARLHSFVLLRYRLCEPQRQAGASPCRSACMLAGTPFIWWHLAAGAWVLSAGVEFLLESGPTLPSAGSSSCLATHLCWLWSSLATGLVRVSLEVRFVGTVPCLQVLAHFVVTNTAVPGLCVLWDFCVSLSELPYSPSGPHLEMQLFIWYFASPLWRRRKTLGYLHSDGIGTPWACVDYPREVQFMRLICPLHSATEGTSFSN